MDPLCYVDSPRLLSILTDACCAFPEPDRTRGLNAIDAGLVTVAWQTETGVDGTDLLVLEARYFDELGSHVLARLDAERYGWRIVDDAIVYQPHTQ